MARIKAGRRPVYLAGALSRFARTMCSAGILSAARYSAGSCCTAARRLRACAVLDAAPDGGIRSHVLQRSNSQRMEELTMERHQLKRFTLGGVTAAVVAALTVGAFAPQAAHAQDKAKPVVMRFVADFPPP